MIGGVHIDPETRRALLHRDRRQYVGGCSGAMSDQHDGQDPREVSIGVRRTTVLCRGCRNAAGRLGMIERRGEQ